MKWLWDRRTNGPGAQEHKRVMSLHSQSHLHSDPRPHPLTEVVSARGLPPLFQAHETEDLKDTVLTLKSTVPTMQTLSRGQTVEILRGQEAHTAWLSKTTRGQWGWTPWRRQKPCVWRTHRNYLSYMKARRTALDRGRRVCKDTQCHTRDHGTWREVQEHSVRRGGRKTAGPLPTQGVSWRPWKIFERLRRVIFILKRSHMYTVCVCVCVCVHA